MCRTISLFFFSSRRRHTRCGRDWSSDVCSSDLFLGFVLSTLVVRSERNRALDGVAKLARDDAQLLTATLTKEQFTKPVTGSSYDELAKKTGKTLTKGSIVGVTVWSSQGQILFSLNESLVE